MSSDSKLANSQGPESTAQESKTEPSASQINEQSPEDTYRRNKLEYLKIVIDYLKHTTTLSTGSILILAAFLEKSFTNPTGKVFVGLALLCFALSIMGSFYAGFMYIAEGDPARTEVESSHSNIVDIVFATFVFFFIGIVLFMVTAFINLF